MASSSSSSTSATPASDPQGWVRNPPSVIVKISGVTSRDSLNGQLALVYSFDATRARYLCLACSDQSQLSLKADNLQVASFVEGMQGQYELIMKDPNVQRHLMQIIHKVQMTTGLSFPKLAGLLLLGFCVSLYFLGTARTFLLLSALLMVAVIVVPELVAGRPTNYMALLKRAPVRVAELLKESQLPFAQRIANTPWMLNGFMAFMILIFLMAMMPTSSQTATAVTASSTTTTANPPPSTWFSSSSSPTSVDVTSTTAAGTAVPAAAVASTTSAIVQEALRAAYRLGFEDAQGQKELFHSSLDDLTQQTSAKVVTSSSTSSSPKRALGVSPTSTIDVDEFALLGETDPVVPPPPPKPASSRLIGKLFSVSNAMSFAYLAQTVYTLGWDPVQATWNFDLAKANLLLLEPWRKGFLAMSLYRIFSSVVLSR